MFEHISRTDILATSDSLVQRWHYEACHGDKGALGRLMAWVYCHAMAYYESKSIEISHLGRYDAEELAARFMMQFESCFRSIENVPRFVRYVTSRNLARHFAENRHGHVSLEEVDPGQLVAHSSEIEIPPWMEWSDAGFALYEEICQEYFEDSDVTREIIAARMGNPSVPFSEIASAMGMNEGATRMRVNRFVRRFREAFAHLRMDTKDE